VPGAHTPTKAVCFVAQHLQCKDRVSGTMTGVADTQERFAFVIIGSLVQNCAVAGIDGAGDMTRIIINCAAHIQNSV